MATIAEQLLGQASQAVTQTPDLTGSIAKGAQLAQGVEQLKIQKAQVAQEREKIDMLKLDKGLSFIETGLTKVPKAARKAFFKAKQSDMGQLGVPMTDDFLEALMSPDINQGALGSTMLDFRNAVREGLENGDFTKARELAGPITEALGGDVEKLGSFMNSAIGSEISARAQERSATASAGQRNIGNLQDLRKEITSHPTTKDTLAIANSYSTVKSSFSGKASGVGDMAGIFAFMKMLDPGSTVREGEYANAENTRGVDESVRALYNKVVGGEKLTPEQRKDFINRAEQRYRNQYAAQTKLNKDYEEIARATGLDPKLVFAGTKFTPPPPVKFSPTAPTTKQDPKVSDFATQYGLTYDQALQILMKRKYKPAGGK